MKLSEVSLQQLINQLLGNQMSTAFRNKSVVTNEISRDIQLSKDKIAVAPVIRHLLATVISNARNGEIYISAERFRDIIILHVQDRNNYNGYALDYSIKAMETEATSAGGSLTIEGAQKRVVNISLSFPSQAGHTTYDC